jgi:AbrB family looped-hinge helix DNA binding protein
MAKEILMTLTSKGQVTIPAEVRRHLKIKQGQKIALILEPDGTVRLKLPRFPTVASLQLVAGKKLRKDLTWDQVLEIAREDALKKHFKKR